MVAVVAAPAADDRGRQLDRIVSIPCFTAVFFLCALAWSLLLGLSLDYPTLVPFAAPTALFVVTAAVGIAFFTLQVVLQLRYDVYQSLKAGRWVILRFHICLGVCLALWAVVHGLVYAQQVWGAAVSVWVPIALLLASLAAAVYWYAPFCSLE